MKKTHGRCHCVCLREVEVVFGVCRKNLVCMCGRCHLLPRQYTFRFVCIGRFIFFYYLVCEFDIFSFLLDGILLLYCLFCFLLFVLFAMVPLMSMFCPMNVLSVSFSLLSQKRDLKSERKQNAFVTKWSQTPSRTEKNVKNNRQKKNVSEYSVICHHHWFDFLRSILLYLHNFLFL